MGVILKNNATSTITTAISASDVGLAVAAGTGSLFPTLGAGDYFYATLVSSGGTYEVIKVTARVGDTMTIMRAQEGTTAQSFASGSRIEARVTAASIQDMLDYHDQASEISFAPTGGISATNVQDAIVEVNTDLAASSGSSLVGHVATGTGATARTIQSKLRDIVSVKDFGAVGDNVADDTVAIQAAITYALASGGAVYFPEGIYRVSASINCGSRIKLFGDGFRSRINPTISNGTGVFNFPAGSNFFSVEDLEVSSSVDFATYLAGGAPQNAIGFKLNQYSSRFYFKNVNFYGLAVGVDVRGFIATMDNLWLQCCDIGLRGNELNSALLNLRCENNKKSFELINSKGVAFDQLLDEGGYSAPLASTLDVGCAGVEFTSPYWEYTLRATPYLSIGVTSECRSIKITGMNLVDYVTAGTAMISADRVDGLDISGHASKSIFGGPTIGTTTNTKNFRQNIWANGALNAAPWLTDDSDQNGACFNYFPNRNFDMWFRGWDDVAVVRSTLTQETSNVRKGANAAKITATAGQAFNYASWTLTGDAVVALRGKTIVVGMWVYIPDIVEFSNDAATRTKFPSIIIQSFNGSAAVTSTTRNSRGSKGVWQFMWNELAVQVDATQLTTCAYVNQSSNVCTGNEYVIVDSIIISEANTPFERLMNDDLPDSPMVPAIGVSGSMITRASATPSDPDQVYAVGDIVWNTAVAAGGSPGWICTTAGVGGVAVFKAMANVAA